jgi:antitoxin component of RelBE/YafQ-DinJ toxin-antitoxin module
MMRLQVTVDDSLGNELQTRARVLGLSVSSYVRYTLKKATSEANLMELAVRDLENGRIESVSLADFKKQIQELA